MTLHRKEYDKLAILTVRVIQHHPSVADTIIGEVINFCLECGKEDFKRDKFMKVIIEMLKARNALPLNSEFINEAMEAANVIPFDKAKQEKPNDK